MDCVWIVLDCVVGTSSKKVILDCVVGINSNYEHEYELENILGINGNDSTWLNESYMFMLSPLKNNASEVNPGDGGDVYTLWIRGRRNFELLSNLNRALELQDITNLHG